MLRLAVVQPGDKLSLYQVAAARTRIFDVTHVVASSPIGAAKSVRNEEELAPLVTEFDACVVHGSLAGRNDLLCRLSEHGKDILFDVGSVLTSSSLDNVARLFQEAKVPLAITQPGRYTPYAGAIREALDANHLGRAGLVRIHRWEKNNPAADNSASPLRQLLVEEIDLACWLFDEAPTFVFGQPIKSDADTVGWLAHIGFSQGMALIDCALHQHAPYYSASLIGSTGAVYGDDHHNTNLLYRQQTEGLRVSNDDEGWRLQLEAFASACDQASLDHTSIDDTRRAIAACDAVIETAQAGRAAKRIGGQYELQ